MQFSFQGPHEPYFKIIGNDFCAIARPSGYTFIKGDGEEYSITRADFIKILGLYQKKCGQTAAAQIKTLLTTFHLI